MSDYDQEDDPSLEEILSVAQKAIRGLATLPEQAKIVSNLSRNEANKVSKELSRVMPPKNRRVRQITAPQLQQQNQPRLEGIRPQDVSMPRANTSYEHFAGRRRRVKGGMELLLGR